jgi:sec-independent protein translocase protein TatA
MPGLTKPSHWIILIVVLLLVFGSRKLPDMARSIGQSMKIFKKEIKELSEDDTSSTSKKTENVEPKNEDKA